MDALFLKVAGLSLNASWLVLAVLILRLLFHRAPKWICCLLWGLVAVRLICPVSIESDFSIVPEWTGSGILNEAQSLSESLGSDDESLLESPENDTESLSEALENDARPLPEAPGSDSARWERKAVISVLGWIWLTGCAILLAYGLVSYLLLRRRVFAATIFQTSLVKKEQVKQSEQVDSPFVLGFFRPVIYLPYQIEESSLAYIIAHEQAHIRRKDHWWKPLGFVLLSVYWFNPLLWLSYILLCRDIETACDEKVIKELGKEERKAYATALLNRSAPRRRPAASPLAFGEIGVKNRIQNVMSYQKPAFWVITLAIAATLIAAVCLLTDPSGDRRFLKRTQKASGEIVETNIDNETGLVSFVMQKEDGTRLEILLTEETHCFSFVEGWSREDFQGGLAADAVVSVTYDRSRRSLVTKEGKEITAYPAEQVEVTGYLKKDAAALSDGTSVDRWQYPNSAVYTLKNKTELLTVQNPGGPENVWVIGRESFHDLGEKAQDRIRAFYQEQGLLYEEKAVLEQAYSDYRKAGKPREFQAYMLSQETSLVSSSSRVICFQTLVLLPNDGASEYEYRIGAVFDKTTGEHIENEDLFSCPMKEAIQVMLDLAGVEDSALREEMKNAFQEEYITFLPDHLEICFPKGTLPSQEYTCILSLAYDEGLSEILYEWAVPTETSITEPAAAAYQYNIV